MTLSRCVENETKPKKKQKKQPKKKKDKEYSASLDILSGANPIADFEEILLKPVRRSLPEIEVSQE